MRHSFLALLLVCASLTAYGQTAPIDSEVLVALRAAIPSARWENALSATGDVLCDGTKQTIVVSDHGDAVWLGVVPQDGGNKARKALTINWPIKAGVQAALCAKPLRIRLYPLNCETEGGKLQGCTTVKHCQAFSIEDDECDPMNVYWDSDRQSLAWWRN